MIASGIDEDGHRHLRGFFLGDRESESSGRDFFLPDPATARWRLQETSQVFEGKCPREVALIESAFDELTAVLALSGKYHRLLRTTNA